MSDASPGYVGTEEDVILARVGAFVLDHFLSIGVAALLTVILANHWQSPVPIYVGFPLVALGYFVVLEGTFGKTVGKKVAGIVVVNFDGSPISYRQSLVRNLLRIVDGFAGYAVGLVVMLINEKPQRVGDQVAGTLVVRARGR